MQLNNQLSQSVDALSASDGSEGAASEGAGPEGADLASSATDVAAAATDWTATLQQTLSQSLTNIWDGVVALVPNLIVALIILAIGYVISAALRWLSAFVLRRIHFDTLCEKTGLIEMANSVGLATTPARLFGQFVFYILMLMFFTVAVDVLGLDNVSQAVHSLIAYLPNAIGALVILIFGLVLANFVRGMVQTASDRVGLEYGNALGGIVFAAMLIVIGTMVVGQLQLETALVNRTIEIVLLAGGAAFAIALGFGTRDAARHIVAGVYARESFTPGSQITVGEFSGELVAVEKVNTKLRSPDGGIIVIPNAQLIETQVQQTT